MIRVKIFYHLNFWFFYIFHSIIRSKKNLVSNDLLHSNQIESVNYYNKLDTKFYISSGYRLKDIPKFKHNSARFYDFYKILIFFPDNYLFDYYLEDLKYKLNKPTFVKNRLIGDNFGILLPLNTWRHFNFFKDEVSFDKKIEKIIWRGAAHQKHRKDFLKFTFKLNFCDVGCVYNKKSPFYARKMAIKDQLKFKFIFSIEGNDIASNLIWILKSNSLCFMKKPKFESWFMQGKLLPNVHYVEIANDFSNLESMFNYYVKNPDKAVKIIKNANKFMFQFQDNLIQREIALDVAKKYFSLSDQIY